MRHVYESDLLADLAFAKRAAAKFAAEPRLTSYADGDIKPGEQLALRWGLGDDCVLVLRLHDYIEPTIYAQLVRTTDSQPGQEGQQQ